VKVHHLNCATLRPFGSRGDRLLPSRLVAHCLLVERPEGLLLVDTGLGTGDLADPGRLGRTFRALVGPVLDPSETALAQLTALGFDVGDLTDIVMTHLDLDHAGGLGDFPDARVHVYAGELDAALAPTLREKARYVGAQWAHGPRWERHRVAGDEWLGFESVTALGDDVLLVPLHGHTRGHCGVAVRDNDDSWLLHAGDAYFSTGEKETPRSCPPGLRAFQTMVEMDRRARRDNQERLRSLHADHGSTVTVFSAHDAAELEALVSRSAT
jgi:glyoxylase-like metal-dependent hydrolase (beta-lactamase superfamily II)